ncbi:MAG: response regulator transcription factor [Ruminococcaceae bacterium]|nr:response regulator transcription factor [Oscillospiraceae bacterium]
MSQIRLISTDMLFSRMLELELSVLGRTFAHTESISMEEMESLVARETCQLLILDLDVRYEGLESMLTLAQDNKIPVILFGYPSSDAMTADKMRFYDSDIYRYVFPRPFLMSQFLYCAKELLCFKEEDQIRRREAPAMVMKQHCTADDIRINENARQVFYKNDLLTFTATEYELLLYLMKQRGTVLTRAQLYEAVWKPEGDVQKKDSNIVDVYIRYIRSKLDEPYRIKLIETVRGVGYTIRKQ